MIEEIDIRDLGAVARATLALGPGLTVLTGETGAGKTMVVTALQLLQGARADTSRVREGAERAEITGRLLVDPDGPVARAVEDAGGELDGDELIVSRRLAATGRTRAWAGGHAVPNGVLGRIMAPLVSIHGQSDQLRLRTPAEQRAVLDEAGGGPLHRAAESYRAAWEAWRELRRRLDDLVAGRQARAAEADRLREDVAVVERVAPRVGELAELEALVGRLDARQDLLRRAGTARQLLSAEDAMPDGRDLLGLAAAARAQLETAPDAALAALADRVAELEAVAQDVAGELSSFIASFDELGEADLARAHERLAELRELERRFGTVDRAIELLETGSARLAELDADDDTRQRLQTEVDRAETARDEAARALGAERRRAAAALAERVTAELHGLAMPEARLEIAVTDRPLDATGGDEVAFLLAGHAEATPLPLARTASGGELSRVMLALELCVSETAEGGTGRTFVFDEVDSGVGGQAAVRIGERLARLARHAQVLVVTHLPQVAAYADTHLAVRRAAGEHAGASDVVRLDDAGRDEELARMLAGRVSATALAHARELRRQSRV